MSKSNEKHGDKIVGIIPARGGSKRVPKKNIKLLGGYSLIAYAVIASKLSAKIARTVVSTDSSEIADIARFYGAEVPFLRPAEIAQDHSTDFELFQHAIKWFSENEGAVPSLFIHLRPTTPLRIPREIDRAINFMREHPESTSLRSVHRLAEPPQKMVQVDKNGFLQGFFPDDPRQGYFNLPSHLFSQAYLPNGFVDIIKTEIVQKSNSLFGSNISAYIIDFAPEVDRPEDFDFLEYQLNKYGNPIYDYLVKHFPKEKKS